MVGPGEVDDDLQPEIEEECQTKYGDIAKVIIFEVDYLLYWTYIFFLWRGENINARNKNS